MAPAKKAWEKAKAAVQARRAPGQVAKAIIANPKLLGALAAAVMTAGAVASGVAVVQANDAKDAAASARDAAALTAQRLAEQLANAKAAEAAASRLRAVVSDLGARAIALGQAMERGDEEIAHDLAGGIESQAERVDKLAEKLEGDPALADAVQETARAAAAAAQELREQIAAGDANLDELAETVDAAVIDLSAAVDKAQAAADAAADTAEEAVDAAGTAQSTADAAGAAAASAQDAADAAQAAADAASDAAALARSLTPSGGFSNANGTAVYSPQGVTVIPFGVKIGVAHPDAPGAMHLIAASVTLGGNDPCGLKWSVSGAGSFSASAQTGPTALFRRAFLQPGLHQVVLEIAPPVGGSCTYEGISVVAQRVAAG